MISLPPARPVPPMGYEELTSVLGGGGELTQTIHPENYGSITGITMDSRNFFYGEMFLAIDGENFRGIDFIAPVFARGGRVFAVAENHLAELQAVMPEEAFLDSCFLLVKNPITAYGLWAAHYLARMGVLRLAITGSAGKTTTKEILTQTLEGYYRVFCSHKNENNHLGVPKSVFALQRELLGGEGIQIAVFEMGMNHSGEIGYLSSLVKPHVALITNVLYSHIGNFSSRQDLVSAKGEIISHLIGYGSEKRTKEGAFEKGILFLPKNIFGKKSLKMIAGSCSPPVTVREAALTVTTATEVRSHRDGFPEAGSGSQVFFSRWRDKITKVGGEVPGISIFMDEILSLVFEAAGLLGIPREDGFRGLMKSFRDSIDADADADADDLGAAPVKAESRLQIVRRPGKAIVIDDTYNSNPVSLKKIVENLIRLLPRFPHSSRLVLVLGDMLELGDFSASLHRECGEMISEIALPEDCQQRLYFFFIGPQMKACYDSTDFPRKKYYERYSSLHPEPLHDLIDTVDRDTVIFFKASHGMKFHLLIHDYLNSPQGPGPRG